MKKFIPIMSMSFLMLAANILTNQANFFTEERTSPVDDSFYDVNSEGEMPSDVNENQNVDPNVYVDPAGAGGRIIIYDNDFQAPKYQRNYVPIIQQ